jgi:hypothetical protein
MSKPPAEDTAIPTLLTLLNSTLHFLASNLPPTLLYPLLRMTGNDTEHIEMTGALEGLECRSYMDGTRRMEDEDREEDMRVVGERREWAC